jgi:hypothetical protein
VRESEMLTTPMGRQASRGGGGDERTRMAQAGGVDHANHGQYSGAVTVHHGGVEEMGPPWS